MSYNMDGSNPGGGFDGMYNFGENSGGGADSLNFLPTDGFYGSDNLGGYGNYGNSGNANNYNNTTNGARMGMGIGVMEMGGMGMEGPMGSGGSNGFDSLSGSIGSGGQIGKSSSGSSFMGTTTFDDEPPLLEELGINFPEIYEKSFSVVFFRGKLSAEKEYDADLAGPLFFCLSLGFCLLLTGKVHFGYIYGFGLTGCFLMYIILNLMSEEGLSFDKTMSILGYALPPIVLLSIFSILFHLKGAAGQTFSVVTILWCTTIATRHIEQALNMRDQRYLIAYPIALLYACFALLTVF